MERKEYIASVLRGLGGQDPEMPERTQKQIDEDNKNTKEYCDRLNKAVTGLENE